MDNRPLHTIFGAGPVGLAVAASLARRGHRIRLVSRTGRAAAPPGTESLAGDASDVDFAAAACKDSSVVYNCLNAPYTRWPTMFPPLQAGVLEGAARAGARLVVMENLYMYGPTAGRPLTEDLPYRATGRKGATRARMSEELMAAHHSGRVRVAIGRASDFFGPGVRQSAMGERVFPQVLAGKAVRVIGNPDALHTYTYVPDIGEALVTLGEDDRALGQAWHIPAAATVTSRSFIEMAGAAAGRPVRIAGVSRPLLKLLGLFSPTFRELGELRFEFEEPFVVDHTRFATTFGDHSTPLAQALGRTVEWYRGTSGLAGLAGDNKVPGSSEPGTF